MKDMRVSQKLIIGFLIVVALSIVIGAVGVYGIVSMNDASEDMYAHKAMPLGDLATAMEYFQRLRVQTREAIINTGDAVKLASIEDDMNLRFTQFEESMANYQPSIVTENGKKLFSEIMDEYTKSFKNGVLEVVKDAKQGKAVPDLVNEMSDTTNSANIIANNLNELTKARMTVMSDANESGKARGNVLLIVIIAVIAASAAISVMLAFYISGLISKPLGFMAKALEQIGTKGDLTLDGETTKSAAECAARKDEIGVCARAVGGLIGRLTAVGTTLETVANGDLTASLAMLSEKDVMGRSIQKMVEGLNEMFSEIHQSTEQVASGSKQIADGSQSLAQGSTEQASAVEQLSNSISEVSSKTKGNSEMAEKAAALGNIIKGNAEKGSAQMDQMMNAVKEINDASQSINKVIKVIDDIAFQTNILALNAAVEAARAGQHGKGFAVVAEEVRSLAAKSAEAAKDTSSMIANSIEKAELGARIAGETAVSLAEIVSGINESSKIVTDIARSSVEQTEAISQINRGIDQVAQVVQQNSATAEESAAASEEMSGQSDMLEQLISRFKLQNGRTNSMIAPLASKTFNAPRNIQNDYDGGYGKY